MSIIDDLASVASGSLGTVTASRNQHGPYTRSRTTPNMPDTPAITEVREALATASHWWNTFLTYAYHPAWNQYAKRQSLTDRLGRRRHRTGREMFIRTNMMRIYFGLRTIEQAPANYYLPEFGLPTVQGHESSNRVYLFFDTAKPWVHEDLAALLVVSSQSRRSTVNFYRGPYRKLGRIDGSSVTPPTSPHLFFSDLQLKNKQRVHLRIRVATGDGRLSTPKWIHGPVFA